MIFCEKNESRNLFLNYFFIFCLIVSPNGDKWYDEQSAFVTPRCLEVLS